jgi:hypothetical protein
MADEPTESTTQPSSDPPAKPKRAAPRKTTKPKSKSPRKTKNAQATFVTGAVRTTRTSSTMPALAPFQPGTESEVSSVRVTYLQLPGLEDAQNNLVTTLKTFMDKVGGAINQVATLEVRTFVSDEIEGIKLENGQLVGDMRLRALTSIELDGDIKAIIPMRADGVDQVLWNAHVDMVKQAQANRTELIRLAMSAASGLLGAIKPI